MNFSKEEFDVMVEELLCSDPISFDMLCNLAEKTLRSKVKVWCQADDTLRGRGYEDDIMQEVSIRLMKTTVTHFLLKEGVGGPVNVDPKGFSSWMTTVAKNLKRDFANRIRGIDFKTENIDSTGMKAKLVRCEKNMDTESIQLLRQAFCVVLSSDIKVYKILTWLAQFIFIVDYDATKINSNKKIIELFENKTLFEMYTMLRVFTSQIEWIEISESQHKKIMSDLQEPWDEKRVYGEICYSEFFMKVNGEKSGKKSISDWMNRMSNMLCRKIGNQKYPTKSREEKE